ncbi:MAG: hypothetical protein WCT25_01465 [Candidatus Paceibacterota bacterium]
MQACGEIVAGSRVGFKPCSRASVVGQKGDTYQLLGFRLSVVYGLLGSIGKEVDSTPLRH